MNDTLNHIEMFPETVTVFADRIEEHSKYLFPLFSIELSIFNPSWNGKIHMLQFNEDPYNRATVETFNEYCKDCMIAFDIIDGKYSFKTSFKYFFKGHTTLYPNYIRCSWFINYRSKIRSNMER